MDVSPDRFLQLCLAVFAFLGVPAFGSTSEQGLLLTRPLETVSELLHDNGRLVRKRWAAARQRCFPCSLALRLKSCGDFLQVLSFCIVAFVTLHLCTSMFFKAISNQRSTTSDILSQSITLVEADTHEDDPLVYSEDVQ